MKKTIIITDFRVNECRNASCYSRLAEEAIASCFGEAGKKIRLSVSYTFCVAEYESTSTEKTRYQVIIEFRSQKIAVTQEIL